MIFHYFILFSIIFSFEMVDFQEFSIVVCQTCFSTSFSQLPEPSGRFGAQLFLASGWPRSQAVWVFPHVTHQKSCEKNDLKWLFTLGLVKWRGFWCLLPSWKRSLGRSSYLWGGLSSFAEHVTRVYTKLSYQKQSKLWFEKELLETRHQASSSQEHVSTAVLWHVHPIRGLKGFSDCTYLQQAAQAQQTKQPRGCFNTARQQTQGLMTSVLTAQ